FYSFVPYNWYEWLKTGANTPNLGQYCISSENNSIAGSGTNGNTPTNGGLTSDLQNRPRFNPNWQDAGCRVFGKKVIIDEYQVGEGCKKWLVRFEYIDWCNPQWAACVTTVYKYEDTTPPVIDVAMTDTISVDVSCVATWTTSPKAVDEGGCDVGLTWTVDVLLPGGKKTLTGRGVMPSITFTDLPAGKWAVHYKVVDGG
ncbi:MAG: hypothetical protein KDC49_23320, partial [Saprospiraceae bacterium]|nr:hypothetical protein [Saprospiraceae bacterium]